MITFFLTICMIVVWVESANFAAGIFQVGYKGDKTKCDKLSYSA